MSQSINVTNHQLLAYYGQITDKLVTIDWYLQAKEIRKWLKENKVRCEAIREKRDAFDKEYYQANEEGKFIKDDKGKYILKDGKTEEEFFKAVGDFMNEQTSMVMI